MFIRRALFAIIPVLFVAILSSCGGAPAVPAPPVDDTGPPPSSFEPLSPDETKRLLAAFPALEPPDGTSDHPVELVLFADFKCPHCREFDRTVLPELKREWIDTGRARLVYVPLPILGPEAMDAAQAALFVYDRNPDAFFPFTEALYGENDPLTSARLQELIRKVDPEIDQASLPKADDRIEGAFRLAQAWGVNGVPTLFVDGEEVDPFDPDAIGRAIEEKGG
ncbi:MAG TPA: thioredoxin domain-containing protein [Clostridiales bacterium]|nr:thioredoxin domain-containing protein [Clostridiales bacterium]